MDKSRYLGNTLSHIVVIDEGGNNGFVKARRDFCRQHKHVWDRRGIITETKIQVYKAVMLTPLLNGCETWSVYQLHARKLNHYHTISLRKLNGIKLQDTIQYTEM